MGGAEEMWDYIDVWILLPVWGGTADGTCRLLFQWHLVWIWATELDRSISTYANNFQMGSEGWRAETAMLQTLIHTWILPYSSTGVKCAFLYIQLVVFVFNSLCCFKSSWSLQIQEHFAIILRRVCVCVWVWVLACLCVCLSVREGDRSICMKTHWMDTLKGKVYLRYFGWSYQ